MSKHKSLIFAVDFDGTIVEHKFPEIGPLVPGAVEVLKELTDLGHRLILFTVRSGAFVDAADEFCAKNGIKLWAVNFNPEQWEWSNSDKVFANYYIDDAALGCPLILPPKKGSRPHVDWAVIRQHLVCEGVLKPL
jgi:hypothetical protein